MQRPASAAVISLFLVPGGGHGGFDLEQTLEAYRVIRAFLARYVPASS